MKQLCLFGDSVFKGVTYDGATGRYHLCKDKLLLPNTPVNNYSKMGATVAVGENIIRRQIGHCTPDTVAVVELGGNDCNYPWDKIAAAPDGTYECAVMPQPFTETLARSIRLLQQTGATVIVSTLFPLSVSKFMSYISNGLDRDGILRWLGDEDHLLRWQSYYSDLVKRTAETCGARVMDLRSHFLQKGYDRLLCDDGIHPTEEGHTLIHRYMQNYLITCF